MISFYTAPALVLIVAILASFTFTTVAVSIAPIRRYEDYILAALLPTLFYLLCRYHELWLPLIERGVQ